MKAVDLYIEASSERDAEKRRALVEQCFAPNSRFVTRSRVLVGPQAVSDMIGRFLADPDFLEIRMTSAIDAAGTTFRYASEVVKRDGTALAFFDAGEIDAEGRIATMLVFAGPL